MEKKEPQYIVVCVPERMSARDLVEYQTSRIMARESAHLVWCKGYLYEYVEEWSTDKPYTHYIAMVNYAPLKDYKRYAIANQGEVAFSDTLKETKGNAIPLIIERAEVTHPRTQSILEKIEAKEEI